MQIDEVLESMVRERDVEYLCLFIGGYGTSLLRAYQWRTPRRNLSLTYAVSIAGAPSHARFCPILFLEGRRNKYDLSSMPERV